MKVTREHKAGLELAIDRWNAAPNVGAFLAELRASVSQASAAPEQEAVFQITHGPLGYLDGLPEWFDLVSLTEAGVENFSNGTKLYTHADPSEVERLRAENSKLKEGFYQKVVDEDLNEIAKFIGDEKLPEKSFFLIPDAARLANMTMHMVREVQALRQQLAEAQSLHRAIRAAIHDSEVFCLPDSIVAALSTQPAEESKNG